MTLAPKTLTGRVVLDPNKVYRSLHSIYRCLATPDSVPISTYYDDFEEVEGPIRPVHATFLALYARSQNGVVFNTYSRAACDWEFIDVSHGPLFSAKNLGELQRGEMPKAMVTCPKCMTMLDWRLENPVSSDTQ